MKKTHLICVLLGCGIIGGIAWFYSTRPAYKIGETGPAGGIVFYDKGETSDDWRYLEAAPIGTEFDNIPWGAYHEEVSGTETAVGSGKRNTELILERLEELGERDCAAQLCADLEYNGFDDWFLPSKDELDLMYRNLKENELGEFGDFYYWSSSRVENYDPYASLLYSWAQYFKNGDETWYLTQYLPHTVRAVRAF